MEYKIYKSAMIANLEKEAELEKEGFLVNKSYTTLKSAINREVNLNWPNYGEGNSPKILSYSGSICLIYKIISDRRLVDGFFQNIRSNNIFLASNIYSIMTKAALSRIPIDAIPERIGRFRKNKDEEAIVDLKNIIREYQNTLKQYEMVDLPMIYEMYSGDLKEEKENLKRPKYTVIEEEYYTYFEMIAGLYELVDRLLKEEGIDEREVVLICPSINRSLKKNLENLETSILEFGMKVSSNENISACISALAIRKNLGGSLSDEEKFTLIKKIKKVKNAIDLKKNLYKYMKEVDFEISEDVPDEEFLKLFYKKYILPEEEEIKAISEVAKLIKELNLFDKKNNRITDEMKLAFIKEFLKFPTPLRIQREKIDLSGLLALTPKQYLDFGVRRKHKIFLDITNRNYDVKIENELNTEIAYLEDEILCNLDKDNLGLFYGDFEEKLNEDRINEIIDEGDYVYLLKSESSIAGYEQDNEFYKQIRGSHD